jgi:hypothetical protein
MPKAGGNEYFPRRTTYPSGGKGWFSPPGRWPAAIAIPKANPIVPLSSTIASSPISIEGYVQIKAGSSLNWSELHKIFFTDSVTWFLLLCLWLCYRCSCSMGPPCSFFISSCYKICLCCTQMDHGWMYTNHSSFAFMQGLNSFINVVTAYMEHNVEALGFINCPCRDCKNLKQWGIMELIMRVWHIMKCEML